MKLGDDRFLTFAVACVAGKEPETEDEEGAKDDDSDEIGILPRSGKRTVQSLDESKSGVDDDETSGDGGDGGDDGEDGEDGEDGDDVSGAIPGGGSVGFHGGQYVASVEEASARKKGGVEKEVGDDDEKDSDDGGQKDMEVLNEEGDEEGDDKNEGEKGDNQEGGSESNNEGEKEGDSSDDDDDNEDEDEIESEADDDEEDDNEEDNDEEMQVDGAQMSSKKGKKSDDPKEKGKIALFRSTF